MKVFFLSISFIIISFSGFSQKYKSVESEITFFSEAPVEDISALNTKGSSIIDIEELTYAFSVPIQEFQFKKSLMQKHFNEKYLESDKFPKSTFTGKIVGFEPGSDEQEVKAVGSLTIHGVTQEVELPATIQLINERLSARSVFKVMLEDYKIKIPSVLWQNIAEEIEVKVNFNYDRYEVN